MCVQCPQLQHSSTSQGPHTVYQLRLHKDVGYTVFPMPGSGLLLIPALSKYYTVAI